MEFLGFDTGQLWFFFFFFFQAWYNAFSYFMVIFVYSHEIYINPCEAVITAPVTEKTFDKVSYYYISLKNTKWTQSWNTSNI